MNQQFSEQAMKDDLTKRYWEELEVRTGASPQNLRARLFSSDARQKHNRFVKLRKVEKEKCKLIIDGLCQVLLSGADTSTDSKTKCANEIENLIKISPEFSLSHAWLGDIYEALGRASEAQKEFKIAAKLAGSWNKNEGMKLLAKVLTKEERQRTYSEITEKKNELFRDGFLNRAVRGDFASPRLRNDSFARINTVLSDKQSTETEAIKFVAENRGYELEVVEAVWLTRELL